MNISISSKLTIYLLIDCFMHGDWLCIETNRQNNGQP